MEEINKLMVSYIVDCILVVSREQALFFFFYLVLFTSVILWAAYRVNGSPSVGGGEECISSLTVGEHPLGWACGLTPNTNSRNYTSEKKFLEKKTSLLTTKTHSTIMIRVVETSTKRAKFYREV